MITEVSETGIMIRKQVLRMNPDERSSAYVEMNCYKWPHALIEYKPDGWDKLNQYPDKHYHPDFRALSDAIFESTSPFDRSKKWWLEKLHRTSEDHLEWWINQMTK